MEVRMKDDMQRYRTLAVCEAFSQRREAFFNLHFTGSVEKLVL
jgi:hypothetical protein